MGQTSKKNIWNKNYILCMAVSTTAAIGHGMFNPALPVYAAKLGFAADIIGTVVAFAMFMCMFGRGVMGSLADRVNNKILVRFSLLILLGGYACFFFADNIPMLVLAKTLQAVGNGMTNTILSTLAFACVPPEKLASGIGMFSLASSLAQCFAPNIGTEIAYSGRFTLLFAIPLVMTLLSLVILTQVKAPQVEKKETGGLRLKPNLGSFLCKPAIPAAIMLLFNGIVYSSISNYLSLYGIERGFARIGIFFTINSVAMLVTRPLTGRICDTKPLAAIMLPGYIAQITACVLLAYTGNMIGICIAALCYGFGFGSTQAAIQVMALKSVGPEQRGKANGTFYIGGDIGLSFGSYAAGSLARHMGYTYLYTGMAAVAACCLLYFIIHSNFSSRAAKKELSSINYAGSKSSGGKNGKLKRKTVLFK